MKAPVTVLRQMSVLNGDGVSGKWFANLLILGLIYDFHFGVQDKNLWRGWSISRSKRSWKGPSRSMQDKC